jgi:hypothetical protein
MQTVTRFNSGFIAPTSNRSITTVLGTIKPFFFILLFGSLNSKYIYPSSYVVKLTLFMFSPAVGAKLPCKREKWGARNRIKHTQFNKFHTTIILVMQIRACLVHSTYKHINLFNVQIIIIYFCSSAMNFMITSGY